ncbi:MAG: disulfide bond formation protein B [Acidimicrobiaceae bacterium]|nr:disulfide bond formation protein B [Acidimicrobiaceae bacterium]|tara:strand:+ start:1260 stop:1772 length:513 start_codon:yes stop_codon:yes gene_type:complete
MDEQAPEIIFTLLLAGALLGPAWILALGKRNLKRELRSLTMELATLVAFGATLGSLYFSEIRNFLPCEFCWYQRIAMYPLALILLIATIRRDRKIIPYALTLSTIGAIISAYHYQLQLFPGQGSSCGLDASCAYKWVEVFGFVTIPLLAFGSFLLISMLLLATPRVLKGN